MAVYKKHVVQLNHEGCANSLHVGADARFWYSYYFTRILLHTICYFLFCCCTVWYVMQHIPHDFAECSDCVTRFLPSEIIELICRVWGLFFCIFSVIHLCKCSIYCYFEIVEWYNGCHLQFIILTYSMIFMRITRCY